VLVLATVALAILLAGGVAQAIINGQPDRNAHPYVGMVYNDKYLCSGTLISPRVFLTAAHCTEAFKQGDSKVYVTFEQRADFKPDDAYIGTPHTHPRYDGFFPDVGVVVLEKPVRMATYGTLPNAGLVETLKEGQRLTAVGYGARGYDLGSEPPLQLQPVLIKHRYRATVRLLNTNDAVGRMFVKTTGISLIKGKGEAGCHGDSGGPLLLPDQQTIVGVFSLLSTPVCRGPGYYQRVDLPGVLRWVRSFR
jgi:secreted trypsin-like serine protease